MTTDQQSLKGKVALVTGGGRGIGRATALELARRHRGADVAVAARHAAEIDGVAMEIRRQGRHALALRVDLADADRKSVV